MNNALAFASGTKKELEYLRKDMLRVVKFLSQKRSNKEFFYCRVFFISNNMDIGLGEIQSISTRLNDED